MFCSGKNRWDCEDYPDYADEEGALRRLDGGSGGDINEPILRRRSDEQGKHERGDQFERRPIAVGGGGCQLEGGRGKPVERHIELQQKQQIVPGPLQEIVEDFDKQTPWDSRNECFSLKQRNNPLASPPFTSEHQAEITAQQMRIETATETAVPLAIESCQNIIRRSFLPEISAGDLPTTLFYAKVPMEEESSSMNSLSTISEGMTRLTTGEDRMSITASHEENAKQLMIDRGYN